MSLSHDDPQFCHTRSRAARQTRLRIRIQPDPSRPPGSSVVLSEAICLAAGRRLQAATSMQPCDAPHANRPFFQDRWLLPVFQG